jgi:hypothetical protein
MKIIREGQDILEERYALVYTNPNNEDDRVYFPCDKDGEILPDPGHDWGHSICLDLEGWESYVHDISHTYHEPMIVECDCGEILVLSFPLDNRCRCGRSFDWDGTLRWAPLPDPEEPEEE